MKFFLICTGLCLGIGIIFLSPFLWFQGKKYHTEHVCKRDFDCITTDYNNNICYNFTGAMKNNPNKKTVESFKYSHEGCQCKNYIITNLCEKK